MIEIKPQFIATDATEPRIGIYGIGDSPEAAISDARENGADGKFATFPATIRLAEMVLDNGGAPATLGEWTISNAVGLADLVRWREDEAEDAAAVAASKSAEFIASLPGYGLTFDDLLHSADAGGWNARPETDIRHHLGKAIGLWLDAGIADLEAQAFSETGLGE